MSTKNMVPFAALIGSLILTGAGCTGSQYAIPANHMNNESALSGAPASPVIVPSQQAAGTGSSAATSAPGAFPGILPADQLDGKQAVIATDKGTIVFEILGDEGPRAASNYIALVRSGFYDGLTFHRVEPGFVIQGGDPLGNGTGGPGYKFEDDPVSLDYRAGIVAMANAGADTNGSQFFVVLEDQPTLPKNYSIFGRVTEGLDVARRISVGDVMRSVVIEDAK